MIKLVITDMDGTLLTTDKRVPLEIYDLIIQLKAQGVAFVAASGRQYYNLVKNFEPVKDDIYYIAENGAFACYGEEELLKTTLPRGTAHELLDNARDIPEVYPVFCTKKTAYITSNEERVIRQVEPYYTRYDYIEDFALVDEDAFKIAYLDFEGSEGNVYPYFKKYEDSLQVCVSAQEWMDVMVKGVNKGAAVAHLQNLLNVTPDETLIFGDFLNDYEMMQQATHSYAMANAHPKLKEVCNYECESNDDNGVVKKIKELFNFK